MHLPPTPYPLQAADQVRHYCDKLLEEVDEPQAAALRQAEGDVLYREGSLKTMREEVRCCVFPYYVTSACVHISTLSVLFILCHQLFIFFFSKLWLRAKREVFVNNAGTLL